jgi:hypothetical protein
MKTKLIIFLLIVLSVTAFSQTPTYQLILKNDSLVSNTIYEFDIYLQRTFLAPLELASISPIFRFNTGISTGGLSFTINSGSSELNSSQQPTSLSIVGDELQIFPRTPPGAGNGTIIPTSPGLRVGRFRITSTLPFSNQHANITWKNSGGLPITKVNAYDISEINVNITDSTGHLNQLSNGTLSPLGISDTSPLPNGIPGASYLDTLHAFNGTPPYTWSITAGTLPNGLTISSQGTISGTPTTAGTSNFTVRVTDNLSTLVSKTFSITIAPGTLSTFIIESSTGGTIGTKNAGNIFQIKITARDAYNNTVTSFTGTADVTSNGTILSGGGTTANFVNGVLSSHSISITTASTNINITATRTSGSETGTSNTFSVNPATASKLIIHTQPSLTAIAGAQLTTQPIIYVEDSYNNIVSTDNSTIVTASAQGGTGLLQGTLTSTAVNGIVSFLNLSYNIAEIVSIHFASGLLIPATSNSISVSHGAATKVRVETSVDGSGIIVPTQDLNAGSFLTIYAIERDFYNNLIQNVSATWSLQNITGGIAPSDLVPALDQKSAAFTGHLSGTAKIQAAISGFDSVQSDVITVLPATANHLVFSQQPTTTPAGSAISPAVSVQLKDVYGNNVLTSGIVVTVSLSNGIGTLSGTKSRTTDANGVASFTDLWIDLVGSKNLTASSGTLTETISSSFVITYGAQDHLAFIQQPTNTTAGSLITPAITVQLKDQFDNNINTPNVLISLEIISGSDTLHGTKTVLTDASGVSSFSGISVQLSGTKIISATSGLLPSLTSSAFIISPASASKISVETAIDGSGVTVPLQTLISGSSLNAYAISRDVYNNFIANISGSWSLDNVTGSVIGTDLVPFDVNRAAIFTGHGAGSANIKATSGSLTPTSSGAITVVAGSVKQLVFSKQPSPAVAGEFISPAIKVQLKDSLGNNVGVANVAISITLGSGTGVLSGTLTRLTNASGAASFDDMSINKTGSKILTAQSGSLISANSDAFSITAGTAVAIGFQQQPPASVIAGTMIAPAITVTLRDTYDNIVPLAGETISLSLTSGTGTLNGTTSIITDATGTAAFSNLNIQKSGEKQLTATRSLFTPVLSNTFIITPASATKILPETAPDDNGSLITAQSIISGNTLTAYPVKRDAYDNFVANDSSATWSLQLITDSVKQSDLTSSILCNCATFTARLTGSAQIHLEKTGLTPINSGTVTVIAGMATKLVYLQQPTDGIAGAILSPAIKVRITDAAGNPIAISGDTITITKKTGTGTLSGTFKKITDISGVATFNDLSIDVSGSKTFEATHGTYSPATSNTFTLSSYTITATSGLHGSISPSGIVNANYGANQTFFITPDIGYHIFDVLVDGSSNGRMTSYTFNNITSDHTISATFAIDTLIISASEGSNGTINPSGTVQVLYGNSQTFTFNPSSGFHVLNYTVDGVINTSAASYTFTNVIANHTISVSFAPDSLNIIASAGIHGNIIPSGTVRVGYATSQPFSIVSDTGYHVFDLSVDGISVGRLQNYTFTSVIIDHTISASFAIDTLTITATAGTHGSISPSGSVNVLFGANQPFSVNPEIGYHISDLIVDGISIGSPSSYTFNNIRSNHSISASFSINTYTINSTAGLHGTITPNGAVSATYGSSSTFTITPDLGYHINVVNVDGVPVIIDTTHTYTFTNISADHTIDASFSPNNITITVQTNPVGMNFKVDGVSYSSTQIFNWIAGESHIIAADTIQAGTTGTQYVWSSWTNGTTPTSIISPLVNTTYTANFTTQYYLTMVANEGGTVTPPSGWFNKGQIVSILATPSLNYSFNIWSGTTGGYSGRTNPSNVTMNLPITETASFTRNPISVTVQTSPNGRAFSYDGTTYLVKQTFTEQPGTSHTIRIASLTQPGVTGTQYVWNNWSDGGTSTHTIFPVSDTTFTANFTTQFNLTMTAGTGGTVLPLTSWQDSNASVLIKATPNKGYIFKGWTGTGIGSYTGLLDSTLITIGGPIMQTATFALDTMIISASAGLHGSISPSGDVKVVYGGNQAFTITPDTLYNVSDVVVDGISVGARTSYSFLNVIAPHTIVASFTINGYTITGTAGLHGTISPSGPIAVDYGASLSFTIAPDTGYYIDSVFVDALYIGAPSIYTFENIASNHTISAKFAPNQLIIAASAGSHGIISPAGNINVSYASSRTFTFLPDSGYHVDSVFVDGSYTGNPINYTFTNIIVPHTINVTFAINKFTITSTSGLHGTLNPLGSVIVNYDDSLVVSILPDTGYHIVSVLVDGLSAGAVPAYTFRNIRKDHTISATFLINNYTIISSAGTNGTIFPAGTVTLQYGSTQTYSIRPGANYHVDSVLVDSVFSGNDTSYTFSNISANHTIRALFAINMMTVLVQTVPDTQSIIVDNISYKSPTQFLWAYGSVHSIAAADTQNVSTVVRYLYSNWSDGGTKRHSVIVVRDTSFTAFFKPQYYLTMNALAGGSITPPSSWQDSARIVSIRGIPSLGYKFNRWTGTGAGSYSDTLNPVNISVLSPITEIAAFDRYLANITVTTTPVGLSIIVDDTTYQSPHLFNWATGTSHSITVVDTQAGATGIRYVWNIWSDSSAKSHIITPLSDTTFTAIFTTQYFLTMNANTGGTVTPTSGWFNRAQNVQINGIPNPGYNFATWAGSGSGSYSGSTNPSAVTMNAPISETANFTRKPVQITIGTNPPGRSFIYNGSTYTATQTRFVDPGSQLSLGAQSPQPDPLPDKQWSWASWSDSGAQAHNIFPITDSSFIANFNPQFALTMSVLPTNGGSTNPSGKRYYTQGDTATVLAIPASGFVFTGWSGASTSTDNPVKIQVNSALSLTANFGRAVQISLTSIPSGRKINVDDSTYTTPKNISWLRGSSHRLAVSTPQSEVAGIRYQFQSWSDAGDTIHFVAPLTDTIYTASFSTEYYLSMAGDVGGIVDPASGWHNKGDTVQISATPNTDYAFYEWYGIGNGSYSGKINQAAVIMNEPIGETAIFSHFIPPPVLAGIPDGAIDVTTSLTISWLVYPGANSYNVQVSTDSTFSDTTLFILHRTGLTDTSIQLSGLANARQYFWHVSVKSGIDESRFSNARKFTTLNATIATTTPAYTWATTFTYPISWASTNLSGNVNIKLSIDSGKTFRAIKENIINNGQTSFTIPDTIALRNIDSCRLRIESFLNNSIVGESNIFSIVSGRLQPTVRLSATISFAPDPLSSTEYRLFSLPGISDTLRVGVYPFGVQRVDWRMFSDNGNADNYLVELSINSYLRTGEGYWMLKRGEFYLPQFDMVMPTLNSDASFNIQIHTGWNIIGNPFDKTIAWQRVLESNNLPLNTQLYSYNGSYTAQSTLEPFKGYYFFNSSNLTNLKIPYPFGNLNPTRTIVPTVWSVKLNYESGINRDYENYLGIAKTAKQGMDMLDNRKPPLFLDQGFLYFPRPVWDETFQRFSSDFRPEIGDGQTWDFEVANPRKSSSIIRFDGIDKIPNDYRVVLINSWNSTPFDLRKDSKYSFTSVAEKMQFKFIVGTADYVEKEIANIIPHEFELVQNFPNPFNSSTSISVKLPRDANIRLDIYNSLGQLVTNVADGYYTAGVHTFSWDGNDAAGSSTASGVYFYRLFEGSTQLQTKKMIMIK